MKKTLVALGILMALAFNTQASLAVCHCHCHQGKQMMKKTHHSRYVRKAYRHRAFPTGAACPLHCPIARPVVQPCCPAAPCCEPCAQPCPCPAAPCYNPCCD